MPGAPHDTGRCKGLPSCGDCMASYRLGLQACEEKAIADGIAALWDDFNQHMFTSGPPTATPSTSLSTVQSGSSDVRLGAEAPGCCLDGSDAARFSSKGTLT